MKVIGVTGQLMAGKDVFCDYLAEELNIPLLGQIPIVQSIREAGDAGRPAILQENTLQSIALMEMVQKAAQDRKSTRLNSSHRT